MIPMEISEIYKFLKTLLSDLKKLFSKSNLVIKFDPQLDLKIWDVGPPYLPIIKKRKVITVHVLNKGKLNTDDCEAFLEIVGSDRRRQRQFPLHWADTLYNAFSSSMERISIGPLREHRLDVAFTEMDNLMEGSAIASTQALATGVKRDQFFLSPGDYQVKITVVSRSGGVAQKRFILHSPNQWLQLNMRSDEINTKIPTAQKFFDTWHSLHMSASVKGAIIMLVGTVFAALIAGIFLLGNTLLEHRLEKDQTKKTTPSSFSNNGFAGKLQQQSANTITNNFFSQREPQDILLNTKQNPQGLKEGSFDSLPADQRISQSRITSPVGAIIESNIASRDVMQPIGMKQEGKNTVITYAPIDLDKLEVTNERRPSLDNFRYRNSKVLEKGDSFFDEYADVSLGVNDIDSLNRARVTLSLPNQSMQTLERIGPGASWEFEFRNRRFKIFLSAVEYITDSFQVNLIEVDKIDLLKK